MSAGQEQALRSRSFALPAAFLAADAEQVRSMGYADKGSFRGHPAVTSFLFLSLTPGGCKSAMSPNLRLWNDAHHGIEDESKFRLEQTWAKSSDSFRSPSSNGPA
jgi:hypothetical protein